jgi:hypothetical protein
MNDQGEEGQVPAPPGLEGGGELPPRPTVRESFRRGLFVRLPTEGETNEGLSGPVQGVPEQPAAENNVYPDQASAGQYPEQVADPYPGWRQAADGSWEAVSPEAYAYSEGYEPANTGTYPEIDQNANFASVAGEEPLIHQETGTEATSPFTFGQEVPETAESASAGAEEAPLAEMPPAPETTFQTAPIAEVVPELASQVAPAPEVAPEAIPTPEVTFQVAPVAEVVPELASQVAPAPEVAPEAIPTPEVTFQVAPVAEATPEVVPVAEVASEAVPRVGATPAVEPVPGAVSAAEDPVAAADLYIPADVELLEGDMPLYGESENVPPRFAGEGLGEPFFIEFGDLARVLIGLRRLLPKGTRVTYNYDYERAWVRTSADIDLPSFAERIQTLAAEGEEASA